MKRFTKHITTVMLSMAMLFAFMPMLGGSNAFADEVAELGKAVTALESASPIEPVQWNDDYTAKKDTNVIEMAQAIVDENATEVEVTEVMTSTTAAGRAIASDGTITYPRSAATHDVTFCLETASEEDFATVSVSLPASVTTKSVYMQEFADSLGEKFLNKNPSMDNVTSNLTIKTGDSYGCVKADWTIPEEASAYLKVSGTNGITVTRPSFDTGDVSCTITATVSWDDEWQMAEYLGYVGDDPQNTITVEFPITIKAFTEDEMAAASEDIAAAWDKLDPIKNYFTGDLTDLEAVDQDLQLSSVRPANGITTTWTSSNPDILEVKTLRAYPKRDEIGGKTRTTRLSVTLSKSGVESTRSYSVTVLPMTQEELDVENEYIDAVTNDISFDTIKKDNLNPRKVTTNLQPVYRGYYDAETGEVTYKTSNTGNTGVVIGWTYSSNVSSGTVTRPAGTEDKDVICTATVKSQRYAGLIENRTVEVPITILAKDTTVDLNEIPTLAGDASTSDFVQVSQEYSLDLDGLFTDLNGDALTYKVSLDSGEYEAVEGNSYSNNWAETGEHVIAFKANDGKADSEEIYTVNLSVLNAEDASAAEELKSYKQEKIDELKNYKDEKDYRAAQKKELAAAIAEGQNNINSAADKNAVDEALAVAKAVIDDIMTSSDFNREELGDVIDEAEVFAEEMTIGDGQGEYPQAAKDALQDAIVSATSVYDDERSDDVAVLKATNDLRAALATAKESANPTTISVNILGQDKENAFSKALYPASVSSDASTRLGYFKPSEYKNQVVAIDAIVVLHQAMYGEDFVNAPTDYLVMSSGGTITKIFGKNTDILGYYVNYEYPTYPDDETIGSVANDTVLEDGDMFNVWIYGTLKYKDKLLYFDRNEFSAENPSAVPVKLYSRQAGIVGSGTETTMAGARLSVIDPDGKEVAEATTGDDGIATIPAVEPGEYVITATSIPYDDEIKDDHFVAPYATLTVGEHVDETTATVTAAVRNYEEADRFDIVPQDIEVSSFAAESYGDLGDCTAGNGGKVTVADMLYTLHAEKFGRAFTPETRQDYISIASGGWITKCFGVETGGQVYFMNNNLSMSGSTYASVLENGDLFDLFMTRDGYNDVPTCFNEQDMIVGLDEEFTLSLMRVNWDGTTEPIQIPDGSEITASTVDKRGYLTEIKGAKADAEGNVKLLFDKPGEYMISATGTAVSEYAPAAKIAAPHCKVTVVDSVEEAKKTAVAQIRELMETTRDSVEHAYEVDIAALKAIVDVKDAGSIDEINAIMTSVTSEVDTLIADKARSDADAAKKKADESRAKAEAAAKNPSAAAVTAANKAKVDAEDAAAKAAVAQATADRALRSAEEALAAAQTDKEKAKAQAILDKATESAKAAADARTAADDAATKAADNVKKASTANDKAKKIRTITVNVKTVNKKAVDKVVKKKGASTAYVTKIVIGKKAKTIKKGTFNTYKKTKTLEIRSKKLTKKSVKGSLKGSKITTIKVKVGKAKANKKYVKKYKKFFTKKNAGKKVKVKR